MLVNLNQILPDAASADYAVPCFNIFGYENGLAVIEAAEALNAPVILACNKDMADYMGINAVAAMFRTLGARSTVPVVAHLDHSYEESTIYRAIGAGFTSVMFDGSQLPLEENIERSRAVVEEAHKQGVTVEGEIGSVPYTSGRDHIKSEFTDPSEAKRFVTETGLDAVAVSVGNVHRMTTPDSTIDFDLLDQIADVVGTTPLVIHGATGIKEQDVSRLVTTKVAKFNIGTAIRKAHGDNLRSLFAEHPDEFDQLFFLKKLRPSIRAEVTRQFQILGNSA